MKREFQILLMLAGISVILVSLAGCSNKKVNKEPEGTVIAEFEWYGKQYITNEELEQKISNLPGYRQQNLAKKDKRLEYFNEDIIDERLKFLAAKDAGLHKSAEIEAKLNEYRHQLVVEKLAKQEVDDKISVTEDDMKDYHEKNKDKYIEPEKNKLTCIVLTDKETAEEALKKIKGGKDIAEVAKELSEMELNLWGGGNKFFDVNSYSWAPEFVKAVSEMKIGEVTPQIVVSEGRGEPVHIIFRKEEVKAPRQKELEEVKNDVQEAVQSEKRTERLNEWLGELYAKSKLEVYKDKIPAPVTETEESEAEATTETEATKEEAAKSEE